MSTTVHTTATGTRLVYRFVTGAELDGVRRTNATWRRKGRQILNDEGSVWAWHFLPRGQRALIRCGGAALAVLLLISYWSAPEQTESLVQLVLGLGVLVFAHWFWTMLQTIDVKVRLLGPLSPVLAKRWNFAPPADPASWIKADRQSRTSADHPIRITVPPHYQESDRQMEQTAKHIARRFRIPVDRMDYALEVPEDGPSEFVVRAMEVPPLEVPFTDARPHLEQASDTKYFLGVGLRNTPVFVDLDLDSPHIALSFGTNGGKSTVVRLLAAQVLRQGGRVVIIDHHKVGDSHADWVYDAHGNLLPGIEFHTDTASAHEALISLDEERERRSQVAHQAKRFKRTPPHFQRTLVVMEEMNGGTPKLNDYWQQLRKDLKPEYGEQPTQSPAMAATSALVCAGRSVRINCIAVAQRFDARVIGGGDVRANFMVRMMARFDEGARKMLIPTIDPKPKSSNWRGRMLLCSEDSATSLQAAFLTPEEAQEWALGGYREVLEAGGVADSESDDLEGAHASDQQDQRTESAEMPALPALPPPDAVELVTLEQAIDAGIVDTNLPNLQWHARRSGFPAKQGKGGKKGTANLYAAHQLADWESKRQRKAAV